MQSVYSFLTDSEAHLSFSRSPTAAKPDRQHDGHGPVAESVPLQAQHDAQTQLTAQVVDAVCCCCSGMSHLGSLHAKIPLVKAG
jgi:cytochrome c1